jgi:hypothetical protein
MRLLPFKIEFQHHEGRRIEGAVVEAAHCPTFGFTDDSRDYRRLGAKFAKFVTLVDDPMTERSHFLGVNNFVTLPQSDWGVSSTTLPMPCEGLGAR